jgi:hypothetical protein
MCDLKKTLKNNLPKSPLRLENTKINFHHSNECRTSPGSVSNPADAVNLRRHKSAGGAGPWGGYNSVTCLFSFVCQLFVCLFVCRLFFFGS